MSSNTPTEERLLKFNILSYKNNRINNMGIYYCMVLFSSDLLSPSQSYFKNLKDLQLFEKICGVETPEATPLTPPMPGIPVSG